MPKMALTARYVETVKPAGKRIEITDTFSPNLVLIVQPTGKKVWAWRGTLAGKFQKKTLGPYPTHDLVMARDWANEITAGRDQGVDIVKAKEEAIAAEEEAKETAAAAAAIVDTRTCDWLFKLYMDDEGSKRASAKEKQRVYDYDIKPAIGSKPVDSIKHDDLAKLVRRKNASAPAAANAMVALIRRWFRWAVTVGRDLSGMTSNPAADLVKLAPPGQRKRYLSDYEITLFLRAVAASNRTMPTVFLFILYTGVRRSEAFELPWSEIDFHKKQWVIPEDRTKNGLAHLLPLPDEVLGILTAQKRKTGNHVLVWPSASGDGTTPMSGFSNEVEALHGAMEKLARLDGKDVEKFSIHDLRRTLASGMNALHDADDRPIIAADTVERVLNHKLGGVAGIYNRYEYMAEKKAALRAWADHLAYLKKVGEQSSR